jgi:hypothetical protein
VIGRVAASALATSLTSLALLSSPCPALASTPAFSGVDPDSSGLVRRLRERSIENKEKYDRQRLDNFYNREYNINKVLGVEVLPEPCDPRDPEFGYRCGSNLPRLPMSRTDPFDDRSRTNASRRGAVFGLNDLNIEEEPGFPGDGTLEKQSDVSGTETQSDDTREEDASTGTREDASVDAQSDVSRIP